jgi:hypothetical protein
MIIIFFEKFVLVDPDNINADMKTEIAKDWDLNNENISELTNYNILRNINVSYPALSSAIVFYSVVAY